MKEDRFIKENIHPSDADLKNKIGKSYQLLESTITSLLSDYNDISCNWKFSKTSGWYLTYDRKKKRLFYLFPIDNDFTLKIVFNERCLKLINDGSFPKFVYQMVSEAKKYPEGTLLIFNKNNFKSDTVFDLLKIKIEQKIT